MPITANKECRIPMLNTTAISDAKQKIGVDFVINVGLGFVVLFFAATGFISYLNTKTLDRDSQLVVHTHEVLSALSDVVSLLKDAETGQRGYLLTGDAAYLQPYTTATAQIDARLEDIKTLTADNLHQQDRILVLRNSISSKLVELKETIDVRRTKGFDAALNIVVTNRGKTDMDTIRDEIKDMRMEERALREERLAEMDEAYRRAIISGILSGMLGVGLSAAVGYLIRRASIARRRQEWLQSGQLGLSAIMAGEQRFERLGENILKFLSEYLDAQAGAFFAAEGHIYRRVASYGLPVDGHSLDRFERGESLLGQAAKDNRRFIVNDVPEGYLNVGSALGQGKPRHLVVSPAESEGVVNAVFELGFIHAPDDKTLELLSNVSEQISIAIRAASYRTHLQSLLEETQRQAEELQAQGEELRVSNEELEEQSRALKESQTRLEQQQAELEQTNSQLEEQTQLLEVQRDDLARSKSVVQLKAQELEQASKYKSDFLANMSHELRTPLNSSLILAKLLADNPDGNLSDEQVKYAQTIQSSGNDLLTLINDILDLSKIEAGHMEVRPETTLLTRMADDLHRMFQPIADQKGLAFKINVDHSCPETIETDKLRLEQVIKNLLSNAFKFTEKGQVELNISRSEKDGRIDFAVRDTGIGISEEQQQAVFDAFRQADGTISRKYGGTGLGLSISRELARLLGGGIQLQSVQGEGSTFTVSIPENYNPSKIQPRPANFSSSTIWEDQLPEKPQKADAPVSQEKPRHIIDDREKLTGSSRTILVIEDDESFGHILYDLAHELNFQCLIAQTAEEGVIVARQYLPHAVVLDVGLPDHSGLSVLDRLKRDPRTRHIPVHIISASDYAETALSLGAVGYMLKPVKREEITEVLKKLEARLERSMRRVLIVEDDDVQRDSMRKLLGSHDVETVGVGTASECLERLKGEDVFDCMVLDLSLPDASGYSLLETLSREDAYSFPPVIVYTGRDLSADEEQRLRKYSKSIIIKGAKSPERLLDEVTLFLHQVVSELPAEQQKMLQKARNRDAVLEGRRILVVEDDVRNVYSLTNILEPRGAIVQIARNGKEALEMLEKGLADPDHAPDLVLMDVMMPEMDGLTATREIRKRAEWKKLPVIMLTAKAMRDDQERCLESGANDYMAKPLDVEKLLSLVRVWMPR